MAAAPRPPRPGRFAFVGNVLFAACDLVLDTSQPFNSVWGDVSDMCACVFFHFPSCAWSR